MMAKQYIFQISGEELDKMIAASKAEPGRGVSINWDSGKLKIAIDEEQFKTMMWSFYHNGGIAASLDALPGISLDPQGS